MRLYRALGSWAVLALMLPAAVQAQQMPLRYFGQQEGLSNLSVTALARDRSGYRWVGTENGLFRYNGASFQRYAQPEGLGNTRITALLVDHDDRLWVSNCDGLFLKVGERLQAVWREERRNGDTCPSRRLAVGPTGNPYMVAGSRLYTLTLRDGQPRVQPVFSEEQVKQQGELANITGVHVDAGAALWMGCGESLCHRDAAGWSVWGPAQGVPPDSWRAILRDRGGQLWARGRSRIVALPAGAQGFVDRTPPGDVLRKFSPQPVLVEDEQGRVLSNVDDGLVRWDQTHWEHFGPANGLRSAGGTSAVQFDQGGGLWLGSRGLGLIHWLGYGNWENWTVGQGMPDGVVLSFVRDGAGVLYAGTRSGLARLLPGAQRFTPMASGLPADQWSSLVLDRGGQAWAASYSGLLAHLDGDDHATVHAQALPLVNRLLLDRTERLWLTTKNGIAVLDTTKRAQPVQPPEGLDQPVGADRVGYRDACQASDGALWFLSARQLLRLDGASWSRFPAQQLGNGIDLYSMSCSADGSLWLSDLQGALWRAHRAGQGLQVKPVDSRLLHGATVFGLHEDRRGWLWVGTDAGIAVWNREHWRFFDQDDGLIWNDTNGNVFYEDADGSMWIATSNGASHVRRPELLFAPRHLGVRIEAAHRAAQPLVPERAWTLPWSSAPLELDLASLDAQNRAMLRFHYRMAGLEDSWAESAVAQVRYAALPPGDYQFEYYASNAYSHRVSPLHRQALTVLPPWWRTTPFYLLCALVALMLLSLQHRVRVRQLLRRQLQTEQLVHDRTLELEQSREQLRQRALRDSLTGAWNRGAILEIIEHALTQASAQQQPLLLVLLDLDHFKRVNDTFGHAAGDAVLRETVARLGATVRQSDAVGRYGGEEFLVLLPGLDAASGHARVEQLRDAIRREPIRVSDEQAITVTGSFGVIAFDPRHPVALAELIDQADQALYRSKENGRDRIEYAGAPA